MSANPPEHGSTPRFALSGTAMIPLRRQDGSVRAYVIVDEADYAWLNQWRWCLHSSGYVQRTYTIRRINYKVYMHRLIMGLRDGDGLLVDHRDHDRLNNTRANLRVATKSENGQNQSGQPNRTSKFRGVSWNRRLRLWVAEGRTLGAPRLTSYHRSEEEAARAASEWRRRYMPYSEEAI